MKYKSLLFTVIISIGLVSHSIAQGTEKDPNKAAAGSNVLKGLKKVSKEEMESGRDIFINPAETPFYREDFTVVKEMDFMRMMMSGNYVLEPYQDSLKVIKAFLMRTATSEEKSQMPKMMGPPIEGKRSVLLDQQAFPFSVQDMNGNNYSIESLKGKIIVMNFWFVECKPCIMEMPELNELTDKYKNSDVVFLGFATNNKPKIEDFLKTKTFKYHIIPASKQVVESYQVEAFPTHIIIDKQSIIRYHTIGLGPNTIQEIEENIQKLSR
jgi:alkyl hydroperoxide reductase subunit AhpC